MKSARWITFLVCLTCSFGTASGVFGQTIWSNPGTGNWNTAANWTAGVPNSASPTAFDAVIENGGTSQLLGIPAGNVRRLRVGRAAGAGNLLVDSVALTVTENFNLNEGGGGISTTTVQNGGSVISPATIVAFTAGTTSNFTVTGTNSTLNSTALTVGLNGTGTLNIQNNATVTTNTLSINASSSVNLNGGTLRFASAGGLNRINYTAGTIQLPDTFDLVTDARVTGLFGSQPVIPANKTLKIEGSGGLRNKNLTVNGGTLSLANLITGDLFDQSGGGLLVLNGGKVTNSAGASLGNNPEATSTDILVHGAGSSWTLSSNLFLGYATITLQEQGLLHVGTDLFTTIDGLINVQGGRLRLSTVSGSGLSRIAFSAGTIQLAGPRIVGADAAINYFFGAAPVLTQLKSLAIEGVASLNNLVTVDGGTFSVGQLSNGSLLDFRRGTLSFTNQNLVIGATGPLGDTLDLAGDKTVNSTLGITNQGLVTGDGRLGGPFNNDTSGELRGEAGRTLTLTGANNTNAGRIYLQGGTVDFNQNLTNAAAGQILGRGTLMTSGSGLLNQGHIALSGGITDIFGDVSNNTGNATRGVSVSGNSDVTFWDDVNNVAGSLLRVAGGSTATFFGTYSGAGISGTGDVYFEADVTPGASPARADFGGNISFGSNANLVMELGGTMAGTQYDQINVGGQMTLGGTLAISLINGFTPAAGQTFDILNGGSIVGAFTSIELPTLSGLSWNTSQLSTGLLSVVSGLLGDYNLDGTVNAADYTVYRNRKAGIGGTTLPNDAGAAGVTIDDYNYWKAHYGETNSGAGAVAAVPEPGALLIHIVGILLTCAGCRKRTRSHSMR